MTCKYTLNEKVIFMDICERFLEVGKKICYQLPSNNGAYLPNNLVTVLIDEETNKPYFEIGDEQRYFEDYDYLPLDELIKKVHKGASSRSQITRQDFMATLFKESDNMGFIFLDQEESRVLRIFCPVDIEKAPKSNWENKILLKSGGVEGELYTSDLFRLIFEGDVKVVNTSHPIKVNQVGLALEKIVRLIRKPRQC